MDAVLGLNHAMSKVSTSRIIETRRMMNCAHSNVDWSSEMRQPIASSSNLTQRCALVFQSERLDALENAIATFDHDDRHRHDTEIEAGADIALVKNLVLLEFKGGFRRDPTKGDMETITEEISTVLKCLECVYRYVIGKVL